MPIQSLRVLHVEDNPSDARLVREDFHEFFVETMEFLHVEAASAAVAMLQEHTVDLVLLDANLPDAAGVESVVKILQAAGSTPVVVLTGNEDRQFIEDALRLGAQNCIVKGSVRGANLVQQVLVDVQRYRDTLEAQIASKEEEQEKARYRSIITNNLDALFILDGSGYVQFVNPAGERLFGRRESELVGHPFGIPLDSPKGTVIDLVRPDGSAVAADMRIMRTWWEEAPGFVVTLRDITAEQAHIRELKEAKTQAEHASLLKSSFLAKMSHELRTPLNAILGYSQMMEVEILGPVGTPKYREYVKSIGQAGTHLLHVVNDLLDLSKIEAEQFTLNETTLELYQVLEDTIRTLGPIAEHQAVRVLFESDNDGVFLKADETRISQIFFNLLSNAIKFAPSGSDVTLRLVSQGVDGVEVQFIDCGCGISKVDQERIFSAFVQAGDVTVARKAEGTGLGLAVSRELAQLHGGTIEVASAVGKGTTMTVTFPRERILPGKATDEKAVEMVPDLASPAERLNCG